jgi:O-antigen/teichoic acid export membrane protein
MPNPVLSEPEQLSGSLLTRNWALNLLGWVVPLSVALLAIPYVVRGLGAERFGVLSIASALLGYFGIFDLGLGRATTKFVAETLARCEPERLPQVVWTSLWAQALFGVLGTVITASVVPVAVNRYLKISPALIRDTQVSLIVLSPSLTVVLIGNALRGVLEAGQRFDVVNYIKVPTNTAMFLLPAVGIFLHLTLPGIILLLVGARVAATIAYLVACLRNFPSLKGKYLPHPESVRPLLVYGGWVTVSNFITPLLAYIDRFIIGSLVSMGAVGYYSAPYEAINRAWVVPATLAATLFPAFTNLDTGGSRQRLEELCSRSLKSLLLISAPTLLVLALFAKQILRGWLGQDFADQSTFTLQILALGMLVNSLALVPFSLLQGIGRPDLTGKFSLVELFFQVICCWLLVRRFGIAGAALAWTLRALLDALLMFGTVFLLNSVSFSSLLQNGLRRSLIAVAILTMSLATVWQWHASFPAQLLFATILVFGFVLLSWSYVLDHRDRSLVLVTLSHVRLALAVMR